MKPNTLASIIASQDGVIALSQCRGLGMSPDAVERLVKAGEWVRLYRGVFRSAQHRSSHAARLRAAVFVTGGVASGPSAAWWHGFSESAPTRPSITIKANRRIAVPPGIDLRHRTLDDEDRCELRALPVTTAELSVLEAHDSTVMDRALQHGMSISDLREVHRRNGKRRGSALITRWLDIAESGGRSEAERLLHRIMKPVRGWQAQFGVGPFALDAAFPDLKVGIEVDGWRWHRDVERNRRDQMRHNRLEIAGWLMLRFDWHRLSKDPEGVLAVILAAVRTRRQRSA